MRLGGHVLTCPPPACAPRAPPPTHTHTHTHTHVSARDPAFVDDKERQYYGVIVPDPSDAASLPVLEL